MPEEPEDILDEWKIGNALIRKYFGIPAEKLPDHEWAKLYNEAIWLKKDEIKTQAELLKKMLG